MGVKSWIRQRFVNPEAVYGLILYSALIGGVSTEDTSSLEVLVVSVFSLVIFWGAHVFSRTIASHGVTDGTETSLRTATRLGFVESSGMLYAAILPTLPILLGVAKVMSTDDAVSLSLLVAMIVLGVLGYQSFAQRQARVITRILGALGTAFFGLLMIILNILVH